jgi:hypothetical protein
LPRAGGFYKRQLPDQALAVFGYHGEIATGLPLARQSSMLFFGPGRGNFCAAVKKP